MVSKYDHALWELLLRHQSGELDCEIPLIVSNHQDLRHVADHFHVRFEVFKITKDNKRDQEDKQLELMKSLGVELVVLARYMQIISNDFCRAFDKAIINIHHSFLPSFIGAKPYHQAHARGVKLVGATVRNDCLSCSLPIVCVLSDHLHVLYSFSCAALGTLCYCRS
jgi:formyltetrahydrofolate deformylase